MNHSLVSIAVVVYNAERTIIDTLDSIYAQTYSLLELIIADDCSSDRTLALCQRWIDKYKNRFARIEIVSSPCNYGVARNCNNAIESCCGEWIKIIAGDDQLLPTCIEDNMNYVQVHPDAVYVFSRMIPFTDSGKIANKKIDYTPFTLSQDAQLHHLECINNFVPAPTGFFNREGIEKAGIRNDERIPMMEDWPRWINILKAGIQLHFMDKDTVRYRLNEDALTSGRKPSIKFRYSRALFFMYYQLDPMLHSKYKWKAIRKYIHAKRILKHAPSDMISSEWKKMHICPLFCR